MFVIVDNKDRYYKRDGSGTLPEIHPSCVINLLATARVSLILWQRKNTHKLSISELLEFKNSEIV